MRRFVCALGFVASGLTFGCGDSSGPGSVAQLLVVAGEGTGVVGDLMPDSLVVRVLNGSGNGVAGLVVTWHVVAGGGTITPASSTSNGTGEARALWTLGRIAGNQRVEARLGEFTATFNVAARADNAVQLVKAGGDGQSTTAGSALTDSLAARAVDAFGNGVPGIAVTWEVTGGGGSVEPASTTTGPDGRATGRVTVGTAAGQNLIRATAAGLTAANFAVNGVAGAAVGVEIVSGDNQTGGITSPMTDSLVIRVVDQHGNGVQGVSVSWATAPGDGSVSPVNTTSRANGEAKTRWTLGSNLGPQSAFVTVGSLGTTPFGANAIASNFNLTIGGMYITQATQTQNRTVPLVAGRNGYLRVWALGNEVRDDRFPKVRVRWYQGGTLVRTDTLLMPGGAQVETAVAESPLNRSWNLPVPGALIQPGLEIEVDGDPEDLIEETNEADNILPAAGRIPFDVRTTSPMTVVLVPVQQTAVSLTGNVNAGNQGSYLVSTRKIFPLETLNSTVHSVYSTGTTLQAGGGGWSQLLSEINALRVSEASNSYYMGIVRVSYFSGVAGIGFVPGRATLTWDHMPSGDGVAAHELGHNLSRFHSPCGGAGNPDPSYPYAGGAIGVHGMDVATATLVAPQITDIMGYCDPQWISDYTYNAVLNYRASNPLIANAGPPRQALLVWGRMEDGQLVLEPAFPVLSRVTLPRESGPYRVEGIDANGSQVFGLSFQAEEVADLPNSRSFAFALPVSAGDLARLAVLRLSDGVAAVEVRQSAQAAAGAAPVEATLSEAAGGQARLQWSAAAYPMVLVRDVATGQVLSFARGGSMLLSRPAREVELTFSDGVRGVTRRMGVSR